MRRILRGIGFSKKRYSTRAIQRDKSEVQEETARFLEWRADIGKFRFGGNDPAHNLSQKYKTTRGVSICISTDRRLVACFEYERLCTVLLLIDCENTVTAASCVTGSVKADTLCSSRSSARYPSHYPSSRYPLPSYIQMDGARTHNLSLALTIRTLMNRHGQPIIPHFNPVEPANGLIKALMRKDPIFGLDAEGIKQQLTLSRCRCRETNPEPR